MLMKKLDRLQNHSTQMPNISENISRIRQLIQQARNAASKVGHTNYYINMQADTHTPERVSLTSLRPPPSR